MYLARRSPRILLALAIVLGAGHPIGVRAADPASQHDLFVAGEGGYHTYRIPAMVVTTRGTLLVFCEGRKTSSTDDGDNDMLLRRSSDGGRSWSVIKLVHEEGGDALVTIGNACPVVDRSTGIVWLTMNRGNDRVLLTHSRDEGKTWALPTDITEMVKKPAWGWYATGPGVGIQLRHGPHRGRLVIPCDHRQTKDRGGPSRSHVIYSDDHGTSWQLGGALGDHSNECQVAERSDGSLIINARNHLARSGGEPELAEQRIIATSDDGGIHWSQMRLDSALIEPTCQASLVRYSYRRGERREWMLFANPASQSGREKMTVRLSLDGGRTWPHSRLLYEPSSAYSCLAVLPDGKVGIVYECDGYQRITFSKFSIDDLRR